MEKIYCSVCGKEIRDLDLHNELVIEGLRGKSFVPKTNCCW